MEPSFVDRAAQAVVGLTLTTRPMSPDIAALWSRFIARVPEIGAAQEPGVPYGVMAPQPGPPEALGYLAGVAVADAAGPVPEGMTAVVIPAGRYAVFRFPWSGLAPAFEFIFGTWQPSSGFRLATSPIVERYGAEFDPGDAASPMEVLVPIVPQTASP